jgi:tetratricopeptide (TPR) repeat protein
LNKKTNAQANLYVQIGATYRLLGDRDQAIENYQKAREIMPENEVVLSALGLVYSEAGRIKESRQAYEACLKINPNNALVLNNLAFLLADGSPSDIDQALNYAQKARGLAPNTPEISDSYGWILLKKGLAEQALPVFKDLTSQHPESATYHYHLAMAYHQQQDAAKEVAELKDAQKHSPAPDEEKKIQEMLARLNSK